MSYKPFMDIGTGSSSPPPPLAGFILPEPGCPSAPIFQELGPPPGYESTSPDPRVLPPPSYYILPKQDAPITRKFNIPTITEEEVRSLLITHVKSKCCWGNNPARELKIDDIKMGSSFHYHLETFTEQRATAWQHEPAPMNQPFSSAQNGTAPTPWQVQVSPSVMFVDETKKLEVPFSSILRRCQECQGIGRVNCVHCFAAGNTVCLFCSGIGVRSDNSAASGRCLQCSGSGRTRCTECNGSGKQDCKECGTRGSLRYYVELTVTWTKHEENFVSDSTGLKEKRIMKVNGVKAVNEESNRLEPLHNFPDHSISEASKMLIDRQLKQHPMERVIRQKHYVRIVPVAIVRYSYRGHSDTFYVYGSDDERKVHFKKYPEKCCCGKCTIQ